MFKFLGLTVGVITDATLYPRRKELFKADVVYITAMQLTFSYLNDNTTKEAKTVVSAVEVWPTVAEPKVHFSNQFQRVVCST